jgi:hypothetical protein
VSRNLFPKVILETDAMVLTDGNVTTAGAAMAQLDLMLSIIARHAGPDLADSCARFLLLDHRQSQSRYMAVSFLTGADERISGAERWRAPDCTGPFRSPTWRKPRDWVCGPLRGAASVPPGFHG